MAGVDDWVVPKDDWVIPETGKPAPAPISAEGAQGSLYDPKNPVLSDDPRYWPPPGTPQPPWWQGGYGPFSSKAPTAERGTFVPLAAEEGKRPELAVPGVIHEPFAGAKQVLKTPLGQGGERGYAQEVGPAGLAAAGAYVPGVGQSLRPTNRVPTIQKPPLSLNPNTAAAARIGRAGIEDQLPRQSTVTDQITGRELADRAEAMINAGRAAGQDVRILDTGGESIQGEARRVSDISPRAQANMAPFTEERWKTQSPRIAEWLRKRMGNPREAHLELQAIKDAAKNPKDAAYNTALTDGSRLPPIPGSARFRTKAGGTTANPGGITLDAGTVDVLRHRTMASIVHDGLRRYQLAWRAGTTTDTHYYNPFDRAGRLKADNQNLDFLDYVKRAWDDAITKARDNNPTRAMQLGDMRTAFLADIDAKVPSYKAARGIAAEAFKAADAVDAGIVIAKNRGISSSEIQVVRNKTPATEWGRVQIGFFTEYMRLVERTGDRQDILRRLAANPIERAKIRAVLGRDVAEDFEAMLYIEEQMQKSYRALHGGSMQARRVERMRMPSFAPSAAIAATGWWFSQSWKGALVGALLYGTRRAEEAFRRAVAERVADKLISNDPKVYMEGIHEARPFLPNLRNSLLPSAPRLITSNPQIMEPGVDDSKEAPKSGIRLPHVDLPVYDPERH